MPQMVYVGVALNNDIGEQMRSKNKENGGQFTIKAGDATGTRASTGGDLVIKSGVGSTAYGNIDLEQFVVTDGVGAHKNQKLHLRDGFERIVINDLGEFMLVDSSMCIRCYTAKKRLSGCAGAYEKDGLCWSCCGH